MTIRRIGVLTGGGDVPGLNACIKAVTLQATELGWDVLGFRSGYRGVLDFNPADPDSGSAYLMPLSPHAVRTIDRMGGTILHTTRISPDQLPPSDLPPFLKETIPKGSDGTFDCTTHMLSVFEALHIDALVALGGDGTLNYGARLEREGLAVMRFPKRWTTMCSEPTTASDFDRHHAIGRIC